MPDCPLPASPVAHPPHTLLFPQMPPSLHLRDSVLLTQALQMRTEEPPGRMGVGGLENLPLPSARPPPTQEPSL